MLSLTRVVSLSGASVFSRADAGAKLAALGRSHAVIEFGLDGTIIDANENFLKLMGYSLSDIKGQHHRMFVDPKEAQSDAYQDFWAALKRGEFRSDCFKRFGKNGKEVWIQGSYNPVFDTKGHAIRVVKIATDVTEDVLRKAEYEGQLQAISKSQAVIEFALDGTILDANDNFLNALGYSLEEVKGQHHRMFVDPVYAESADYAAFWETLARGEFQADKYKRLGKGGREVWIQATYNPILDPMGVPIKVVKYATDVTEDVLRNADHKGQLEAIGKSQAVIEFKPGGMIIDANDNFLNALGYSLEEVKGKHHRMFVDPDLAADPEYAAFWEKLGRGEFQAGKYPRLSKEGREVWIQATYNPILDPSGKVFKIVKFATDVTEEETARQEAERVGRQVDEKLAQILAAIEGANERSSSAASASEQTSQTVQVIAATVQEFEASSREIAQNMAESQGDVERASTEADRADESTRRLSTMADSMTGIVELIQDIASQINLLSLNATIESARAGEAGKGFAVVASEVKNLANQVGQAIQQISDDIEGMQTVSAEVVTSLQGIRGAFKAVKDRITDVAGAVEEQSASTGELANNMQLASSAVGEITSNLGILSAAIGETTGFAQEGIDMYRSLRG